MTPLKRARRVIQDGNEKEQFFNTPYYFLLCIPEMTSYFIYEKDKRGFIVHKYLKTTSFNDRFFSQNMIFYN